MTPTLIVLGLLALGVVIVVLATRRRGPDAARPVDAKTGWDAPVTPGDASVAATERAQLDHSAGTGEPMARKEARR